MTRPHFKDQILDELAREHNVAQFVSFSPDLSQRYARLRDLEPNRRFATPFDAVEALLRRSAENKVNIRSFEPDQPRSREFIQGCGETQEVLQHLDRLARLGLTTIVNETINVSDGGVSGVATPQTLEFAPDATPRCVEEDDVARLPRRLGDELLSAVYGFAPELPTGSNLRLEFSIHPEPRGWLNRHTILWEKQAVPRQTPTVTPVWPNKFSRFLGDKTFGLIVAWLAGLPVPKTTVISRRVAAFSFGDDTGELEHWIRTSPAKKTAGKYTTARGWLDPFKLLALEDPEHSNISSVLSQQSVRPVYSGGLITEATGGVVIQGVRGPGNVYMVEGESEKLPPRITRDVTALYNLAYGSFGAVRFEWVHDDRRPWIVQLNIGQSPGSGDIIVPGDAIEWIEVPASIKLEQLRELASGIDRARQGIILVGTIGMSSHKVELLIDANIPSRLRRPARDSGRDES